MERIGSIPYGYQLSNDGIHLEERPEEQDVISEIKMLRSAGLNLSAICRELERRGFLTRSGTPFRAEQVKRILAA